MIRETPGTLWLRLGSTSGNDERAALGNGRHPASRRIGGPRKGTAEPSDGMPRIYLSNHARSLKEPLVPMPVIGSTFPAPPDQVGPRGVGRRACSSGRMREDALMSPYPYEALGFTPEQIRVIFLRKCHGVGRQIPPIETPESEEEARHLREVLMEARRQRRSSRPFHEDEPGIKDDADRYRGLLSEHVAYRSCANGLRCPGRQSIGCRTDGRVLCLSPQRCRCARADHLSCRSIRRE